MTSLRNVLKHRVFKLLILKCILITILSYCLINRRQGDEWTNSTLDGKNFDHLSANEIMAYFEWTNRSSCRLVHYFGGIMARRPANASVQVGEFASGNVVPMSGFDGHYAVCLDPIPVAPKPDNCTVYSFGIKNEWSFDDDFEKYGCQVHSFDPAMNGTDFDRSPQIHFHNLALNDVDEGNQNRTLLTIFEMLKHEFLDHVKIDIEGDEWRIIPQIIRSGMLGRMKQLALEIHLNPKEDLEYLRRMANVIKSLEDHGMIRFDSYYNHWSFAHFPALNQTGYFAYIMAWYNSKYSAV